MLIRMKKNKIVGKDSDVSEIEPTDVVERLWRGKEGENLETSTSNLKPNKIHIQRFKGLGEMNRRNFGRPQWIRRIGCSKR